MSLPTFSGNKADFHQFRHTYVELAKSASVICPFNHGLLGYLLPAAEWLALPFPVGHIPAAFAPAAHPGVEPVLPNGATALAVSTHRTHWDQWKFATQQYQTQHKDLCDFKVLLLAALDPVSRRRLTDPATGTMNVSVGDIDAFLVLHHGTLVVTDYTALLAMLSAPYTLGTPLTDLLQRHRDAHAIALSQGQPFPAIQKVHYLKTALRPCGRFENCIMVWQLAHPLVANQTFAGVTALEDFNDAFDTNATSSSLGFAASISSPAVTVQMVTELIVAAVTASSQSRPRVPAATATAHSPRRAGPSLRIHYCWTHGPRQNHTSRQCLKPAPGHDHTATSTDKKCGKT